MNSQLETWIHRADAAAEILRQATPLIIEGISAKTKTGIADFASSELGVKAKGVLTQLEIAGGLAQIALPVLLEETVGRPVAAAGQAVKQDVENRAGKMLAKVMRSRRIEERNLSPSRKQRREAAQAAMGTANQREMRQLFQEAPDGVVQALKLPDPRGVETDFQTQARVGNGQKHNPYIPLAEQDPKIGQIEYDPKDPRITGLQKFLGVPIHPRVLKDESGQIVEVYDWRRPEREDRDGRRLTGPLEPKVMDKEGNFVRVVEYRTVMVPNVAGAVARAELREMVTALGEDLADRRTEAIIARLDTLAEHQRDGFSSRFVAEVFSLARTGCSPRDAVDRCLQTENPFLNSGYFPGVNLRQPSNLESARKPWWRKLLTRPKPIRVTRFKARGS